MDFSEFEKKAEKEDCSMMRTFRMLSHIDVIRAASVIESKAAQYMEDWNNEEKPTHSNTIDKWRGVWDENKTIEELCITEAMGYKL